MKKTRVHTRPASRFRTGVSLHSHTLHSRESLNFIYQAARRSALLRTVLRRGEARYQAIHGSPLDLNRAWWTPPLAPVDAFAVESAQIRALGLAPLVSFTDHDDIEAPMSLQAVDASRDIPVSVEWTVPYGPTFFHLGVHNLNPREARAIMGRLGAFTYDPCYTELTSILADLDADPATLIVFNHPLWDEKGVGADLHRKAAIDLLATRGGYLHAIEINGLRPWQENDAAVRLAADWGKPAISGGDRHAVEPNANINLTNASTFAEFAAEVRQEWSDVLLMPQYHIPHARRIFSNMLDVFRRYENHGRGWSDWADRVFFQQESGDVASLTQLWGQRPPAPVALFANFMHLASRTRKPVALPAQ